LAKREPTLATPPQSSEPQPLEQEDEPVKDPYE
jgi:hypothetical protein